MEIIWDDLTEEGDSFKSPTWHQEALAKTQARIKAGKEEILDWEEAKKQLRTDFP